MPNPLTTQLENAITRLTAGESQAPKPAIFKDYSASIQSDRLSLEAMPSELKDAVYSLAGALLDPESMKTIIYGGPLAGKSFVTEQVILNMKELIKQSHMETIEFYSYSEFDVMEVQNPQALREAFGQFMAQRPELKPENVCFVTESIEAALFITSHLPGVRLLLEMNTESFHQVMRTAHSRASRIWNSWQIVQVDNYAYTPSQLAKLLELTILPRMAARYKDALTPKQLRSFLTYAFREMPEILEEYENKKFTTVPPGVWASCLKQLVSNINHKRLQEFTTKQGAVRLNRLMAYTLDECEGYFRPYLGLEEGGLLPEELEALFNGVGSKPVVISADDLPEGMSLKQLLERQGDGSEEPAIPVEPLKFKDVDSLEERLKRTIMGQEEALEKVSNGMVVSAAGLNDPHKPLKSFLFLGPTGVGKTQLALDLAKQVAEEEMHVVRIDMSEYQSAHEVAKLFGAPPGYLGFEKGGILTSAVAEHPKSIVLLDEIEKAHDKIFDAFLQVLDAGHMTDSMGKVIDFTQTIVIMTSNLGVAEAVKPRGGFAARALEAEAFVARRRDNRATIMRELERTLRPEFLNRIDEIVIFDELTPDIARRIVSREISIVSERLDSRGYKLSQPSEDILDLILEKSDIARYGAREVQRNVLRNVSEPLARFVVTHKEAKHLTLALDGERRITVAPLDEK